MDVGLVVNFSGLIATAFALLASMALAVELGAAPAKKSGKNKSTKDNSASSAAPQSARSSSRRGASSARNSADNANDQTQEPTAKSVEMEKTVVTHKDSSAEAINDLQRTYVDGLLGPRIKYDVALAILNEFEATSVSDEEAGRLMATQAYLSATRSGSLTSGAFSFGGGDKTQSKKQSEEIDAPKRKNTRETSTMPNRKTGERSRPATSDLSRGQERASKKTTTGDKSEPRRTTRNTKRKNTRPE